MLGGKRIVYAFERFSREVKEDESSRGKRSRASAVGFVGSMMDLSLSMATLGAQQVGAVLGEAASRQTLGTALRLLQQSAAATAVVLPDELGLEWRSCANKLEAFEHFQQASSLVGLAPGGYPSLAEQLRRAAALGPYRSVWTAEGLGHARAESAWIAGETPRPLWPDAGPDGLPASAAVPLHTGAALSFASRLLATNEARSREGLARWIALWEECALPGYGGGIAVEALGLAARNLHPHLLSLLDELLGSLDPAFPGYLWHGVGRGLYFAPTHAVPYSAAHGRALAKAWREPPGEVGRRNAIAGLAWALTLVNFRDPELLAEVLRRHGWEIADGEAFAHGVASAVLVWHDAVGPDSHLSAFLAYRPARGSFWRDLVLAPCEEALQDTRLRQGLAARFHYAPREASKP